LIYILIPLRSLFNLIVDDHSSQRTAIMTPTFILGFAAAAVILHIIRSLVNSWQHARKASLAADKAKALPALAEQRVQTISDIENRNVTTFIIRNLGRDLYFTVDPKNIQAVLATQFKDFELGEIRRRSVHPLLGTGIVRHTMVAA
jgi:hypothetical protein